jgi:hypothetical protein
VTRALHECASPGLPPRYCPGIAPTTRLARGPYCFRDVAPCWRWQCERRTKRSHIYARAELTFSTTRHDRIDLGFAKCAFDRIHQCYAEQVTGVVYSMIIQGRHGDTLMCVALKIISISIRC